MWNRYLKLSLAEKIFFTPAFLFIILNLSYLLVNGFDVLFKALFATSFQDMTPGQGYFTNILYDINPFYWLKALVFVFIFEMIGIIYLAFKKI